MRQLRQLRLRAGRGRVRLEPFPAGAQVEHDQWGPGQVQRYEGDRVVILFESVGYRTLGIDMVLDRELLRPRGA